MKLSISGISSLLFLSTTTGALFFAHGADGAAGAAEERRDYRRLGPRSAKKPLSQDDYDTKLDEIAKKKCLPIKTAYETAEAATEDAEKAVTDTTDDLTGAATDAVTGLNTAFPTDDPDAYLSMCKSLEDEVKAYKEAVEALKRIDKILLEAPGKLQDIVDKYIAKLNEKCLASSLDCTTSDIPTDCATGGPCGGRCRQLSNDAS